MTADTTQWCADPKRDRDDGTGRDHRMDWHGHGGLLDLDSDNHAVGTVHSQR